MDLSKLTNEDLEQLNNVILEMHIAYERLLHGTAVLRECVKEDIIKGFEGLQMFATEIMTLEEKLRMVYNKRKEIQTEVDRVLRLSQRQALVKRNEKSSEKQTRKKES